MRIVTVLILIFAFLGSAGLFLVQYLNDKRLRGAYVHRIFWDFKNLNQREKAVLMGTLIFLTLAIIIGISQGQI